MEEAAILNFCKSEILGHNNPYMVNLYQPAKFEANIFINDRDMAKHRKSKMAAATILNFGKSGMLGYSHPDMVNPYQHTKFD